MKRTLDFIERHKACGVDGSSVGQVVRVSVDDYSEGLWPTVVFRCEVCKAELEIAKEQAS